jgi:hypothetical protein
MRQLSQSNIDALFAQETDKVYVTLITLTHPDWGGPFRFARNMEAVEHDGETYIAVDFGIMLPSDEEGKLTEVRLAIDNVDRLLIEAVTVIETSPMVELKVVRADEPDEIVLGPLNLRLNDVKVNKYVIEGTLTKANRTGITFPKSAYTFTPNNAPSIHGAP